MKKSSFVKVIAGTLITVSALFLNPITANAEWENVGGRYKYKEGSSYVTGWKYLDNDWYCFDSNGVIKSGWISYNGNWYFCYIHGQMAHDTTINGYYLNSNGVWTNSISADEAKKLVLNQDGIWIKGKENLSYGYSKLSTDVTRISADNVPFSYNDWGIEKEDFYQLSLNEYGTDGSYGTTICNYFVGINSKKVYAFPNQGNMDAYQMEHNEKVKTFKFTRGNSTSWH